MIDRIYSGRPRAGRSRSWAIRAGTVIFVVGAIIALLMTLSGARELLDQVNAAPDSKSGFITMVIGFGLVLLGPVLLVALGMLIPHQWLPTAFERIDAFLAGDGSKENHPQASR